MTALRSLILASVHQFKPAQSKAQGQYRMVLNKAADRGEVWLYGTIGMDWFGDGVTAKQFADDLKKLGNVSTIDLRINSDGGVVTDARAMYNLLVEHKAKVITHIDGIAASAASFVAMAGSEIEIAEGGFIMIHEARGVTIGNADDHRRMAGVLEQVNQTIVDTYVARTKQDGKQVKKWMAAETWFTGKEAVANGFADRIVENLKVAASIAHPELFKHLPSALLPKRAAAVAKLAALARV
jgi:ATP-dependent Clp protease protease subunit